MVGTFLLALALVTQQGDATGRDPVQALPPQVRAMLPLLSPPYNADVSLATRFSNDTVFAGEQVELVTAIWFSRDLRATLRSQPRLTPPSLSGLWSTQVVDLPTLTLSRTVGGRIFDLYLMNQTLFPLGASTIKTSSSRLDYAVPLSASFFAPEERRTLTSAPAVLVVLPVPANLATALGNGPTARGLSVVWRGPASGLAAGTPTVVELLVRGFGNVTLWPSPEIAWPPGVHVYTDPTEESVSDNGPFSGGEKRFRYTIVADSAGVMTLPHVSYPYFEPSRRTVVVAEAPAFALPVVPGNGVSRARLRVADDTTVPLATSIVDRVGVILGVLALLPLMQFLRIRRRRVRVIPVTTASDPEEELRRMLGTPVDAAPERVTAALRQRGVSRDEAEAVRRWLVAVARKRYGPDSSGTVPSSDVLLKVLARLRGGAVLLLCLALSAAPLRAQREGVSRYAGGDYPAAVTAFEQQLTRTPHAPTVWRNLAAAHWLQGDDVGAAAAWLRALALAPRDPVTRAAWRNAAAFPPDVKGIAPTIPLSRDELLLLACAAWLLAWACWQLRWRRIAMLCGTVALASAAIVASRWLELRQPQALLRAGTTLRISPTPSAPPLGDATEWTRVQVERRVAGWYLVRTERDLAGWVASRNVAPLNAMPAEEQP